MKFTVYPKYSRSRVNKAGQSVRDGNLCKEDEQVIENWRASHAYILNTFQATLRRHVKSDDITIAQRLKRRSTIHDKLIRQPAMELARMHDLAGCRLIFNSIDELNKFREKIHNSKFKHELKNSIDDYDYIKNPKADGYRGIHDVYSYVSYSPQADNWNGLRIELQYRTKIQHAWATAVEIAGSITGNEAKFGRGDEGYKIYFQISSELIARKFEKKCSCLPDAKKDVIIKKLDEIDEIHNITSIIDAMHVSTTHFKNTKNIILRIPKDDSVLHIYTFENTKSALKEYEELELEHKSDNIVLVRGDTHEAIRSAFRNYFSDASEFTRILRKARK